MKHNRTVPSDLLLNATSIANKMDNAFIPRVKEDGVVLGGIGANVFKRRRNYGFIPMSGGETPSGLYMSMIQDPQEKLLAYFLTGGRNDDLDEKMLDLMQDIDKVVILGHTLDQRLVLAFIVDRYDRNRNIIPFPHFQSVWSIQACMNKLWDERSLLP